MSTADDSVPCGNLDKGDFVMYFDPEYSLWFKNQIAKVTDNYFIIYAIAWDKNDLKPIVSRNSDLLESETNTAVQWEASTEVNGGYIRVQPPHIPPSIQRVRELEQEHEQARFEQ